MRAIFCFPILFCMMGCAGPLQNISHGPDSSRIYLIELPGMAGWTGTDVDWTKAMGSALGTSHQEIYDWTTPHWMIGAVMAYEHNRQAAQYIASRIADKLRAE